jgi:hypothetical protein
MAFRPASVIIGRLHNEISNSNADAIIPWIRCIEPLHAGVLKAKRS